MRVVTSLAMRPLGPGYDPRGLLRYPVRALRGGADGLALGFRTSGGAVEVEVLALGACSSEEVDQALLIARRMSGVDDDPSEFLAMVRHHPVVGPLVRGSVPRMWRTPTVFESFTEAVLAQLVTGDEARWARGRLWRFAGEAIPGTDLRAAPTANAVRDVPSWKMISMGIAARRLETLREGARRGTAIERIGREEEPRAFMEKLMSIRGVGRWTANRVARNALGYADAVPVADFHAPRVVTFALTGNPDGDDETMLAALEPFRPHRARVATLLERGSIGRDTGDGYPRRRPRVDAHRRTPWRT